MLTALLSLLGFAAACDKDEGMMMYGTPHADFEVNATFVDRDDKPVSGLLVGFGREPYVFQKTRGGNVWARYTEFSPDSVRVTVEDIDGAQNGWFVDTMYRFKVEKSDIISSDDKSGWNSGTVRKSVTVNLKERK